MLALTSFNKPLMTTLSSSALCRKSLERRSRTSHPDVALLVSVSVAVVAARVEAEAQAAGNREVVDVLALEEPLQPTVMVRQSRPSARCLRLAVPCARVGRRRMLA